MTSERKFDTEILAIDPGTTQSGFVWLAGKTVVQAGVAPNETVLAHLAGRAHCTLAVEMVASYGMPVGKDVFETVRWIGRFQQAWHAPDEVLLITRPEVKMHLCHSMRAKDANVWQALVDRFGAPGTKKNPGALYGVHSHARSALAVAVTALDRLEKKPHTKPTTLPEHLT